MSGSEAEERAAVVTAAASWVGTPYRHQGRIKGLQGGVDCIMLIAESFTEAGLLPHQTLPYYPQDWHLHRSAERYITGLSEHTREIPGPPAQMPQPGDIALWRFGRCFSHGALVVQWPIIIHAYVNQGCVREDVSRCPWLRLIGENAEGKGRERPVKFFSFWRA